MVTTDTCFIQFFIYFFFLGHFIHIKNVKFDIIERSSSTVTSQNTRHTRQTDFVIFEAYRLLFVL